MFFVFLIAFLLLFVFVLVNFVKSYKIPRDHVLMITGTMGSGKSLVGVNHCISLRSKISLIENWSILYHNILPWKWKNIKLIHPLIYSNIPIASKFYRPLTSDMLIRSEVMNEHCIIFCDEFG